MYIEEGKDRVKNGYTPRNLLAPGLEATKAKCIEKMELFGSIGKLIQPIMLRPSRVKRAGGLFLLS